MQRMKIDARMKYEDGDDYDYDNDNDDNEDDDCDDDYHASSELVLTRYLSILSAHKKWAGAAWISSTTMCL